MHSYSFTLKKALPPRRSFAITRTHYIGGEKIQENYRDSFLTSVNESFLSKAIDYNLALQKLTKHLAQLKSVEKIEYIVDSETKHIMERHLAQQAKQLAKEKIRPATFQKLESEILLLQELSKGEDLLHADEEAVHDLLSVKSKRLAVATINKLIVLINRLRKLAGITAKIPHRKDKTMAGSRVEYLKPEEISSLLVNVDELDYHIIRFAIATGLREGEMFGIEKKTFRNGFLDITRQLYRDGTSGNPKNDRRRTLPLSKIGKQSFDYLIKNHKQFLAQRNTFSNRLRRLTQLHLGHAYSVYDLRHTYAVNCLQANIGALKLCGWMGNSVTVLQEHYIGFMVDATDDDVKKLNAI